MPHKCWEQIMDRVEFLKLRVAALEQSIHANKKLIDLCKIVKDVDVETQKSDITELERRISIDKELLSAREAELGK
jgi:hypothetical protein